MTQGSSVRYRRSMAAPLTYDVKEVSEMLGLSLGSTYSLCRDGSLPAVRLGGRWLIPRKRFHEWLDSVPGEVA